MTTLSPTARLTAPVAALALAVLGAFPAPGYAETTEWANNEGGRMRIVALSPDARGNVRGALQIEPKAGWITYWREPGDAGIPPHIAFSETSGVRLTKMSYPVPRRFDNGDISDIGYDGPVTFPFELTLTAPKGRIPITASAFIGICRNICIPFQAEFSLSLNQDAGTSFSEAMIINEAESELPEAPSGDFALTSHTLSSDEKTIGLQLKLPKGAPKKPQVIVTGPEGHVILDDIGSKRDGDSYALDMAVGKLPKGYEVRGKQWGILVLAGDRAMETTLSFE